jgi:hypothetical protein
MAYFTPGDERGPRLSKNLTVGVFMGLNASPAIGSLYAWRKSFPNMFFCILGRDVAERILGLFGFRLRGFSDPKEEGRDQDNRNRKQQGDSHLHSRFVGRGVHATGTGQQHRRQKHKYHHRGTEAQSKKDFCLSPCLRASVVQYLISHKYTSAKRMGQRPTTKNQYIRQSSTPRLFPAP